MPTAGRNPTRELSSSALSRPSCQAQRMTGRSPFTTFMPGAALAGAQAQGAVSGPSLRLRMSRTRQAKTAIQALASRSPHAAQRTRASNVQRAAFAKSGSVIKADIQIGS